jgi:hypothetical protein
LGDVSHLPGRAFGGDVDFCSRTAYTIPAERASRARTAERASFRWRSDAATTNVQRVVGKSHGHASVCMVFWPAVFPGSSIMISTPYGAPQQA